MNKVFVLKASTGSEIISGHFDASAKESPRISGNHSLTVGFERFNPGTFGLSCGSNAETGFK